MLQVERFTGSAPTWKGAVLASEAMPLYRPDVLGVPAECSDRGALMHAFAWWLS